MPKIVFSKLSPPIFIDSRIDACDTKEKKIQVALCSALEKGSESKRTVRTAVAHEGVLQEGERQRKEGGRDEDHKLFKRLGELPYST